MLAIYKTIEGRISPVESFDDGIWVHLTNPTEEEISKVASELNAEVDFLRAALDDEERARIETDNGQTLVIVDIPMIDNEGAYSTIPLGIILLKQAIVTVCLREDSLLKDFAIGRVKTFLTQFKTRFLLQVLYRNAALYLSYLKQIDKLSSQIEAKLHKSMRNSELIQMLKLEKSLVYFSTSLKSNETVLERLARYEAVKKYPEDKELLDDVITENKQAIEMANIYSSILSGTMDAFASIISNNLNIVMKLLASITIVMSIPTMIASFFGMNVDLPFNVGVGAFWWIVGVSLLACLGVGYVLYKRDMF